MPRDEVGRTPLLSATETLAKHMLPIAKAAAYWPWGVPGSLVVGGAKRTLREDVERGFYLVRFGLE